MIWPLPMNRRMSPILAEQLLDINAMCASEEREIADFPEYASTLTPKQLIRLRAIAAEVIRSHETQSPITGISIVGHADVALKEPVHLRKAKEQKVSDDRARHAEKQLVDAIRDMPGGSRVSAMIHTKAAGVGSSEPAILHPLNEEQMRRNRRVVFKWSRCVLPSPIIHFPLEFPERPPRDPKDDPNVVFAGNHFRIKILDGVSAGEVFGAFSYHLMIWDIDNERAAEYSYTGALNTVGVPPFTECGESDWSRVFTVDSFLQVDQFAGTGSHASGSVGLTSAMQYTFLTFTEATVTMSASEKTVNILAGPSKSLGAEFAKSGNRKIIPGSVKVFKGP